jgi:hypothetical protein
MSLVFQFQPSNKDKRLKYAQAWRSKQMGSTYEVQRQVQTTLDDQNNVSALEPNALISLEFWPKPLQNKRNNTVFRFLHFPEEQLAIINVCGGEEREGGEWNQKLYLIFGPRYRRSQHLVASQAPLQLAENSLCCICQFQPSVWRVLCGEEGLGRSRIPVRSW